MLASVSFSLCGFLLTHGPCCKISCCSADMCRIYSMTLSSQLCFSGLQGFPVSWQLWLNLKVRLLSLWLLSSMASTALENEWILIGTINTEDGSRGVWEFSSLPESVLSHFYFDGPWFNLTCSITWLWFYKLLRTWWQISFSVFKKCRYFSVLRPFLCFLPCLIRPDFVSEAEICVAIENEECWLGEILTEGLSRAKKENFSKINMAHP